MTPIADRLLVRPRPVIFSDTTLREGDQMPGSRLDADGKVEIARLLEALGVQSIDAGFPANSERERQAVRRVAESVTGVVVSGLARAVRSDIDAVASALSTTPRERSAVTVFIGTSPVHRTDKLGMSIDQIEATVRREIAYAASVVGTAAFSPEDATRTEPEVLVRLYRAAFEAGARVLGYTDTVGIATPDDVREVLGFLFAELPELEGAYFAVHFHDDLGLAVANTVAAADLGADIVQVALNGVGERAGNASLEEVALTLHLHEHRYGRPVMLNLDRLYGACHQSAHRTGPQIHAHKALLGANVYRTEAGVHQDGIMKNPQTYLPYDPGVVGGPGITLVLGPSSGRAAFAARFASLGLGLNPEAESEVIRRMKEADRAEWDDPDALLRTKVAEVGV